MVPAHKPTDVISMPTPLLMETTRDLRVELANAQTDAAAADANVPRRQASARSRRSRRRINPLLLVAEDPQPPQPGCPFGNPNSKSPIQKSVRKSR